VLKVGDIFLAELGVVLLGFPFEFGWGSLGWTRYLLAVEYGIRDLV